MKRVLSVVLMLFVIFTATACGSNGATVSLQVSDNIVELYKGEEFTLGVTAKSDDKEVEADKITYSSENTDVAIVSGGTITAIAVGETNVSVKYLNATANVNVIVKKDVYEIKLSKSNAYLKTGSSADIPLESFTKNGAEADKSLLTCASENENVAIIENSKVKGVGTGVTKINLSYGEVKTYFVVNVYAGDVTLESENNIALSTGYSVGTPVKNFIVDGAKTDADFIQMVSEDQSIARVNGKVITGMKVGETKIGYYYKDEKIGEANVKVYESASTAEVQNLNGAVDVWGRAYRDENDALTFDNVNSGLDFWFVGTECKLILDVEEYGVKNNNYTYLGVYLDEEIKEGFANGKIEDDAFIDSYGDFSLKGKFFPLNVHGENVEFTLLSDLSYGVHHVRILKATEQGFSGQSALKVKSIAQSANFKVIKSQAAAKSLVIDCYGDSISCGGGIYGDKDVYYYETRVEDGTKSYSAIVSRAINAKMSMVSKSGMAGGLDLGAGVTFSNVWNKYSKYNSIEYAINPDTDIVIINLGTNDFVALNGGGKSAEGTYKRYNKTTGDYDTITEYTEDMFKEDVKSVLTDMQAVYTNPDVKYIWCYGAMGELDIVKNNIIAVLEEMGGEAANYYYCSLPINTQGSAAHPNVAGHMMCAKALLNVMYDKGII